LSIYIWIEAGSSPGWLSWCVLYAYITHMFIHSQHIFPIFCHICVRISVCYYQWHCVTF